MSVEAVAWAFRQKVPPKPKMVMVALADQADETTGKVCYGKTDMKHIAAKASCGERSLYRYIAALIRNGYVRKQSGKERGHGNEYWLCIDRAVAESIKDWQWKLDEDAEPDVDVDDDRDTPDVGGGSAILADPPEAENEAEAPQNGRGGLPHGGRHESSESHPTSVARARDSRPSSFSRQAQDLEIETGNIRAAAAKAEAKTFVYENSDAWRAWCTYRRARSQPGSLPTCTHIVDDKPKRGWWMPSLYPPRDEPKSPTDPPKESSAA